MVGTVDLDAQPVRAGDPLRPGRLQKPSDQAAVLPAANAQTAALSAVRQAAEDRLLGPSTDLA